MSTDAEKRGAAIDTVARHAIAVGIEHALSCGLLDWGDYPDIGEHDWEAVVKRARQIVGSISPPEAGYAAAYEHLAEQVRGVPA